ncbi:unnamed protein product [Hymenolepis diminuta]|uniref:Uncharacterized protein n=1 Tax=Hymenolepis diminuta TaxID=6216 RepID=A0A564XYP8_HYMDI|nr:unnamed protein product [Hymenolepis diminuta]
MKQWVDTRRDQSYHPHSTRSGSYYPGRYKADLNCSFCADDVQIRPTERNRYPSNGAVSRVVRAYNRSYSSSESSVSDGRNHRFRNRITHGTSRHNPQHDPNIINGGFSTNDRNRRHQRRKPNASRNSSDGDSTPHNDASGSRSLSSERECQRHFNRWWHGLENRNRYRHLQ